jgi:hypothetical protein
MFEPASDLGFRPETMAADWVVSVAVVDLLECDLAVQRAVEGDEDQPQAPLRVQPQSEPTSQM